MKPFCASLAAIFLLGSWVHAQEKTDPKKVVPPLIKDLGNKKDPGARLQAIVGLADFGPHAAAAVPGLIDALQDKDEDLRLNAAIALGKIGKPAVEPLSKLLGSQDDDTRFYAVWALGWIGPEAGSTSPAIVRLLADKNDGVRRKAAYTLGRINADPAASIAALVKAFEDPQEDVRVAAAEGVAKFGAQALPPLIAALKSDKDTIRFKAAHALAEMGSEAKDAVPALKELFLAKGGNPHAYTQALAKIGKASIPAMAEALKDDRPEVRSQAVAVLGQIGAEAVPVLVDALGAKHVEVRRQAAAVLAPLRVGDKMVVLAFAFGLKDEDEQVQMQCLAGLQVLGATAKLAAPHLHEALAHPNFQVRQQAFYTLQAMNEDPRPGLAKALDSKDPKIRINTASLMMVSGVDQNTALPILIDGLKNEDATLKMQSAHALAVTRREVARVMPILIEGLKNKSAAVRTQAIQALQNMGKDAAQAAPALIEAMSDADANVRQQAMYALQNVRGNPDIVVPALAKRLKEETNVSVRQQIISILPQYGAKAFPHITEALKDKDANIRQQAIYALQNMQGDFKSIMPQLEAMLKDENAQVRMALTQSLWRAGEPAVPILIRLLKDKDQNVWMNAVYSLRNLGDKGAKAVPVLLEMAREKDANRHQHAISALANSALGVDELLKMHKDAKNGPARAHLIRTIAYSQHRHKAVPLILEGLKDKDVQVKIAAIQTLQNGNIQSKEALSALKDLIKEDHEQVRHSAIHALGPLGQEAWTVLEESLKASKDTNTRQAILQTMANHGVRVKSAVPELISCLKDTSPQVRSQACMVLGNAQAGAKEALPALRELLNDTNAQVRTLAQNAIQQIGANNK